MQLTSNQIPEMLSGVYELLNWNGQCERMLKLWNGKATIKRMQAEHDGTAKYQDISGTKIPGTKTSIQRTPPYHVVQASHMALNLMATWAKKTNGD